MNADVLVAALVLAIELRQFVDAVEAEMTETLLVEAGETPRGCCCCWRANEEWYGCKEEEEGLSLPAGPCPLLAKALTVDAPHIPMSRSPIAPAPTAPRKRRPRFHAGSSSDTTLDVADMGPCLDEVACETNDADEADEERELRPMRACAPPAGSSKRSAASGGGAYENWPCGGGGCAGGGGPGGGCAGGAWWA